MRIALIIVALFALLIGSMMLEKPQERAELTVAYTNIITLDAQMMNASEDIRLCYALYEPMLTVDNLTFEVKPGMAEQWEANADRSSFTFHIRKNAKWSDGHALTAYDFAYAWRVGLMPDTAPEYIGFLYNLRGGKDFFQWCADELKSVQELPDGEDKIEAGRKRIQDSIKKFDEMVGVTVIDDYTIQVEVENPLPYFEEIMTTWAMVPLPRHILEDPKLGLTTMDTTTLMLRRNPQWIKPAKRKGDPVTMVTNGPYRLTSWRFKRDLMMEANEHYWNKDAVGPKTLRLVSCKDPKTNFDTYESGEVDLMINAQTLSFAPELVEAAQAGKRNDVQKYDAFGTYYYIYNNRPELANGEKNPFADARVRKAFSMVIDKKAIVEDVTRQHQTIARSFIGPTWIDGYTPPKGLKSIDDAGDDEDARNAIVAEAKQLLRDAGYPDRESFPAIEVLYNTGGGHELVAQALKNMWERHLDVPVQLNSMEWKVFSSRRTEGKFTIARGGWFGDYMDPTTFLDLFKTDEGNNDAGFADETYDALLAKAAQINDPAERLKVLSEAETYAIDEHQPILPLYYYSTINLFNPDHLSQVSDHPRGLQMFYRMRMK